MKRGLYIATDGGVGMLQVCQRPADLDFRQGSSIKIRISQLVLLVFKVTKGHWEVLLTLVIVTCIRSLQCSVACVTSLDFFDHVTFSTQRQSDPYKTRFSHSMNLFFCKPPILPLSAPKSTLKDNGSIFSCRNITPSQEFSIALSSPQAHNGSNHGARSCWMGVHNGRQWHL